MNLQDIYKPSTSLLTDLYQLTMAEAHWKTGTAQEESVFHLYFRNNPFESGFSIACGLEQAIEFCTNCSFKDSDIEYLKSIESVKGTPLFSAEFLSFLQKDEWRITVDAIAEGSIVFPNEPLLRVQGPGYQCQLVESGLLNILNFQTLIATKAARIRAAAGEDQVLEFGLRRAQGMDGAISASRAAYVGGVNATSNVLAGNIWGIPVRGTHAHSWVMKFEKEVDAFLNFGRSMPDNCILLVDTYDTVEGIRNAITAGNILRQEGIELQGIRLDSGDLAYLSNVARNLLDAAGFTDVRIVASNDLNEHIISSLKNEQEAQIDIWGIGTQLVSAYSQPALPGVYKMGAHRTSPTAAWVDKIKLSESKAKISIPGIHKVKRFINEGMYVADMIYDERYLKAEHLIIDPSDETRRKAIDPDWTSIDLLQRVVESGKRVNAPKDLKEIRAFAQEEVEKLDRSIRRFSNPHIYPVGLEKGLYDVRNKLIFGEE